MKILPNSFIFIKTPSPHPHLPSVYVGWFDVQRGIGQGYILSPYLFDVYAENIVRNVRDEQEITKSGSFIIEDHHIPEIRYAEKTKKFLTH